MNIIADLHTHTIACSHAYSTVLELSHFAALKQLKLIAVTDHGPAMSDGAHPWHFGNLKCLPPYIEGVRVLHGAEANITDFDGSLDLEENTLRDLDWVIASFHSPVCAPGTVAQHTQAYLKLAENPYVDVIGHSGTDDFRFDYEAVLPVLKKHGKLIEINSHSFSVRPGASKNCREIALTCKKLQLPIVVTSDAHVCFDVGDVEQAVRMLEEIDFPPELVLNTDMLRLGKWINERRKRIIVESL